MSDLEALLRLLQRGGRLKTWHVLLLGEIIGERLGRRPRVEVPAELPPPEVPPKVPRELIEKLEELAEKVRPREVVTRVKDVKDVHVTFEYDVFKIPTRGKLHELMIRSPSDRYTIYLAADGIAKLHRSFPELEEVSEYLRAIDAFKVDEEYVLRIADFSWLEAASCIIRVEKPITFHNIYVKWDEINL